MRHDPDDKFRKWKEGLRKALKKLSADNGKEDFNMG